MNATYTRYVDLIIGELFPERCLHGEIIDVTAHLITIISTQKDYLFKNHVPTLRTRLLLSLTDAVIKIIGYCY